MKITPIPPQSNINKIKRSAYVPGGSNSVSSGNDEVNISESAQSFAAVYKAVQNEINNTSPEYQARVENIAQRVQDGSYSVKSEEVAQKIIEGTFIF